jgi:hypothetical protein
MVGMIAMSPLTFRAGPGARKHIAANGLAPEDIACIPAAAGGPKGLALIPLDKLLHRELLPRAPSVELIGASIGAWRHSRKPMPCPRSNACSTHTCMSRITRSSRRPATSQTRADASCADSSVIARCECDPA